MRFADLARTLQAAEHLLLPPECLLCHEAVEERAGDSLVCDLCQSRWRRLPEPVCSRCGQPMDPGIECRICETWPTALQRVRSAVWFDGSVRGAIHHLKYEGWWRVAEAAARSMRRLEPLESGVVLVPVPLAMKRLRRRGYNQSERIARALGAERGFRVQEGLLSRVPGDGDADGPHAGGEKGECRGSLPSHPGSIGSLRPGGRRVYYRGDSRGRRSRTGGGWSGARGSGYLCSRDDTDRVKRNTGMRDRDQPSLGSQGE